MDQREKRLEILAEGLLRDARDALVLSMGFLDKALYRYSFLAVEEKVVGTDARQVYYNGVKLLKKFKEETNAPTRDLLHMTLHCMLSHPFSMAGRNRRLWNLSADMEVENVLMQLQLGIGATYRDGEEREVLERWKVRGIPLTAEHVYRELESGRVTEERMFYLEKLFYRDDHVCWDEEKNTGEEEDWKEIAQQVMMDLETYSKDLVGRSASLVQNLQHAHRDRVDYTEFLRKFAVMREEMVVNDEEFDYVFYTYGMKLYGNMPLIEPLEYAEEVRIKDFVIALDTSGSCSGELIQMFLTKTYSVLMSTGSFFKKVNIYIVQCDSRIQQVIRITNPQEFEAYMKGFQAIGLGGTDFRPVFHFVDELLESGEIENLKGLIYFTDGLGRFPAKKPRYDAAFVFVQEEEKAKVPSWAIKITLEEQELRM